VRGESLQHYCNYTIHYTVYEYNTTIHNSNIQNYILFYPGQFLCGQADPEAAGTKMRGVKRRLTLMDGGVGRILNIIVQATPGGNAGGRPAGKAAA
jgi:hypothetical protein